MRGRLFGQRHLYLVDASAFDRVGRETEVVRGHDVALFQKIALDFEHQSRQRLGLALDVGEGVFGQLQDAFEVADVGLAVEEVVAVVELGVGAFDGVAFV